MQKCLASAKLPSVIWYMPTAVDAGRYTSKGSDFHDQRQYVRATGFPEASTWARAAKRVGVMMLVEYFLKMGWYARQVSTGVLFNVPLTGKNNSEGLRSTWNIQFTPSQTIRMTARPMMSFAARGAGSHQRFARRASFLVRRQNLTTTDANLERRGLALRRTIGVPRYDGHAVGIRVINDLDLLTPELPHDSGHFRI